MKIGTAATNVAYAVRRTTVRGPRGGVYHGRTVIAGRRGYYGGGVYARRGVYMRGGGYYGGRYYGGGVYARRGVYARGGYYGRGVYASRGVYARGPRGGVYASRGVYARGPRGGVYGRRTVYRGRKFWRKSWKGLGRHQMCKRLTSTNGRLIGGHINSAAKGQAVATFFRPRVRFCAGFRMPGGGRIPRANNRRPKSAGARNRGVQGTAGA